MKLYFIGIGGISMSALAKFLRDKGNEVLGSDIVSTDAIAQLEERGIRVLIPQKKQNIDRSIDEIIYTSAITPGSPGDAELQEAKKLGIKIVKRAEKIGELTKKYKTIAIAGTHGKSTTTAMVLQILLEAGKDPSALLGSDFDRIGSNYRLGRSDLLIIEADEFDRSFLNFQVDFGAILNVDADHLDYFKGGIEEIKKVFAKYIKDNFKRNSFLVYNAEDGNIKQILGKVKRNDIKKAAFGAGGDYQMSALKNLAIPGTHNRRNGLAALALAEAAGVPRPKAVKSLNKFKGASRRFDFRGEKKGVKVYDDYAHHPAEIKATLQAAREKFKKNKIIVVFQPHQYSRTKFFADGFSRNLAAADVVIIPPIYQVPGRDEKKEIDNFGLVEMIKKMNKEVMAANNFDEAVKLLNKIAKPGDIVLVMGAGPVDEIATQFLKL